MCSNLTNQRLINGFKVELNVGGKASVLALDELAAKCWFCGNVLVLPQQNRRVKQNITPSNPITYAFIRGKFVFTTHCTAIKSFID